MRMKTFMIMKDDRDDTNHDDADNDEKNVTECDDDDGDGHGHAGDNDDDDDTGLDREGDHDTDSDIDMMIRRRMRMKIKRMVNIIVMAMVRVVISCQSKTNAERIATKVAIMITVAINLFPRLVPIPPARILKPEFTEMDFIWGGSVLASSICSWIQYQRLMCEKIRPNPKP